MAINVVRFVVESETRWGVVEGNVVRPLPERYESTAALLAGAASTLHDGTHLFAPELALDDLEVVSPVTSDQQFICQAINYRSHLVESGFSPATSPFNVFFRKASSSITSATGDIVCPLHVKFLDYEVEIGLVLAGDVSTPTTVTGTGLAGHVAALVALNDVSARDEQLAEGQFFKAKSYRTFGPVGPHLTLVDQHDLDRFSELRLRLWVNGELRQDAYAAEMVHRPAASLTELSAVQDWRVGDLVATGTPGGCALRAPVAPIRMLAQVLSPKRRRALVQRSAAKNTRRLRSGDLVELHIGTDDGAIDLGKQRTLVV